MKPLFSRLTFQSSCKIIEQDSNYINNVSNEELFNLIRDEEGNSRYDPRKSAIAIEDSKISKEGCKVYNLRIAQKSSTDLDDYPVWNIDDSAVILVNEKGETSMHSKKNALQNKWDTPCNHLNVNQFLNRESLHSQFSPQPQ